MKTCNNCSTINEATALKCVACNMHDNFTPMHGMTVEEPVTETANLQCANCGSFHPGEGAHCVHCRFPLDRVQVTSFPGKKLQLFRKVG